MEQYRINRSYYPHYSNDRGIHHTTWRVSTVQPAKQMLNPRLNFAYHADMIWMFKDQLHLLGTT